MRAGWLPSMGLAFCALFVAGCGLATYESRLESTREFFEYMQTLNNNLARNTWERRELGLSMRVPQPFNAPMPAPPAPKEDEEGNLLYEPDLRQPDYLGIDLPGLVEGWRSELPGAGPVADSIFLYAMTNHDRFATEAASGPAPNAFLADLEYILGEAFGVTIPDGESAQPADNMRYRLIAPPPGSMQEKYTTRKDYLAIRYVPEQPVAGQMLQGLLFERQVGDIQVAILCICSQSVSTQFRDRLLLSLETLAVSGQTPRPAAAGGAATGGGGGTSGF